MYKSKNKIQLDKNTADIYKFYCETTGNPKKLTQRQFSVITKNFFAVVIDKMIHEGYEITFPKRLGNLRITKRLIKPKLTPKGELDKRSLRINYGKTKEMWRRLYPDKKMEEIYTIPQKPVIYHDNKHSNGYSHKWDWDKRTCLVKNAHYYKFDMCRANDRLFAKELLDPKQNLDFYTQK